MERTATYIDFEAGEVKEMNTGDTVKGVYPVGSVIGFNSNTNPNDYGISGVWMAAGSLTIGILDVYYFQRID